MVAERLNDNTPELQLDDPSTLSDDEVSQVDFASIMESTDPETIPQKERMTKEYINRNFYVNGVSAEHLKNCVIKKITENVYSVKFDHNFEEGEKQMDIVFETKYDKNSGFMTFKEYRISIDGSMKKHDLNSTFEVDATTHNQYDVRTAGNGKRENFSIVYNEQKTKEYIRNIVKAKEITHKKEFDIVDDLENTQLTKLNNPILGDEVYEDGDGGYYRTLYYTTGGKKVNITNVYFNPNGEFNVEKTLQQKESLKIMGIDVEYTINENGEFSLGDSGKEALIERVRHDRDLLINMLNKTSIADPEVFSGLEKLEKNGAFQFDTHIIYLDPIAGPGMSGLYSIKLNKDKNLEPLYCKVEGDNVLLTDETGKATDTVYFNYEDKNNKKATNYYKITKGSDRLNIVKLKNKFENPTDILPMYSGDNHAIESLNRSGNLTHYENSSLEYTDRNGNLVSKMPCHRLEDLSYEVNEEYSTKIESQKLYDYTGFKDKNLKQRIETLTKELGIVDAYKLEIFEKCLKDKGVEFTQKLIEITDTKQTIRPGAYESRYYKLGNNFEINLDKGLYDKVEECLKLMESRLKLAKQINNSHVKRRNGKTYKDFESFIGGETGVGKHIIAPDELKKFISGESNEVTVRISRGMGKAGENVDILYKADGEKLRTGLKSGEERGRAFLDPQRYSIYAINKENKKDDLHPGDVVFDPIEERE